jgi:hypothetical protein
LVGKVLKLVSKLRNVLDGQPFAQFQQSDWSNCPLAKNQGHPNNLWMVSVRILKQFCAKRNRNLPVADRADLHDPANVRLPDSPGLSLYRKHDLG